MFMCVCMYVCMCVRAVNITNVSANCVLNCLWKWHFHWFAQYVNGIYYQQYCTTFHITVHLWLYYPQCDGMCKKHPKFESTRKRLGNKKKIKRTSRCDSLFQFHVTNGIVFGYGVHPIPSGALHHWIVCVYIYIYTCDCVCIYVCVCLCTCVRVSVFVSRLFGLFENLCINCKLFEW